MGGRLVAAVPVLAAATLARPSVHRRGNRQPRAAHPSRVAATATAAWRSPSGVHLTRSYPLSQERITKAKQFDVYSGPFPGPCTTAAAAAPDQWELLRARAASYGWPV